jgi:hypothetical protein
MGFRARRIRRCGVDSGGLGQSDLAMPQHAARWGIAKSLCPSHTQHSHPQHIDSAGPLRAPSWLGAWTLDALATPHQNRDQLLTRDKRIFRIRLALCSLGAVLLEAFDPTGRLLLRGIQPLWMLDHCPG